MNLKQLAYEALLESGLILQEDDLVETCDSGTREGALLGWEHRVRRLPKSKIRNLKFAIVPVCKAPFNNHESALAWAKSNVVGVMSPEESGGKGVVTISVSSIREMLNQRQREKSSSNEVHYAALTKLREIINEGMILESHPDYKKDANGKRSLAAGVNEDVKINIAYSALSFGENYYRVKMTFKSYPVINKSKAYAYEVCEIEVLPGTLGGKANLTTNPSGKTSICANSLLKNSVGVNGQPFL